MKRLTTTGLEANNKNYIPIYTWGTLPKQASRYSYARIENDTWGPFTVGGLLLQYRDDLDATMPYQIVNNPSPWFEVVNSSLANDNPTNAYHTQGSFTIPAAMSLNGIARSSVHAAGGSTQASVVCLAKNTTNARSGFASVSYLGTAGYDSYLDSGVVAQSFVATDVLYALYENHGNGSWMLTQPAEWFIQIVKLAGQI